MVENTKQALTLIQSAHFWSYNVSDGIVEKVQVLIGSCQLGKANPFLGAFRSYTGR